MNDKPHKDVNFEVNDAPQMHEKGKISFDELVELAFPGRNPADGFRITFDRGHGNASGRVELGGQVELVDGMDFTVTPTGRS